MKERRGSLNSKGVANAGSGNSDTVPKCDATPLIRLGARYSLLARCSSKLVLVRSKSLGPFINSTGTMMFYALENKTRDKNVLLA